MKQNIILIETCSYNIYVCILGPSKIASTISSTLIKKRPAADSGTTDAKKMHLENSSPKNGNNTSSENGAETTKNGV